MIRCIIIDDEPLASKLIQSYAEKMEELEVLGTYTNPLDALSFLKTNNVDLIFLDVMMPELSGVQLAKIIPPDIQVIFTTAYQEYAVEGFELKALDYLVKPISFSRFINAVHRYKDLFTKEPESDQSNLSHIFVKTEYRLQKVDLDDILFFKGMGDYTAIHTKQGRIMTLEKMKEFEARLKNHDFLRVHKSYIISLQRVEFVEKRSVVIGTETIPIGAKYEEEFRKWIG